MGASEVDEHFLWGIDAAFVVDRKGSGDDVTSCRSYIPFCDKRFGTFVEETVKKHKGCPVGLAQTVATAIPRFGLLMGFRA